MHEFLELWHSQRHTEFVVLFNTLTFSVVVVVFSVDVVVVLAEV
jgi:hypothetical protein